MSDTTILDEVAAASPPAFPARGRRVVLGKLTLTSRFLLSPLAGYTNFPFRLVVREVGGLGLATTDLINARALLRGTPRTLEMIETSAADAPLAVQIYGADAREMAEAARWLQDYGVAVVDINMGCPVHKVVKGGGGSAMMCDPSGTVGLVRAVVEAVRIPVTVKMRLGWDEHNLTAPFFAREFEQAGVAGVIIHGRTRAQGFHGHVNRDGIRAVVEAVARIPVIGNGDVRNIVDAQTMLRETGCAGVSIGRGALLNPWIFRDLACWERTGQPGPRPEYGQRIDFMSRHLYLLAKQRGERFACLTFRKMANWYCRALRVGRDVQQRLVMLATLADFEDIIAELRDQGPPPSWHHGPEPQVPVPRGPIERW
ncbi:MAG: tRNA dihydrouridine synthase DusB [Planctomycetes bacterium]|nr:tRNA dihydrouridine synthase DusB [Planctomycetota bacterium]